MLVNIIRNVSEIPSRPPHRILLSGGREYLGADGASVTASVNERRVGGMWDGKQLEIRISLSSGRVCQ